MRFVSLHTPRGTTVAGLLLPGDRVADLSHPSCAALLDGTPPSIGRFIEDGLERWRRRLAEARFAADAMRPLAQVRLAAPLAPGKIVGAAFNFTDALAERQMASPPEPVTFVRAGSTV